MTCIERTTRETTIRVAILKPTTESRIATSIPFLDHMLATLARYSGLALSVDAKGDLRHHIVEDVAIPAPYPRDDAFRVSDAYGELCRVVSRSLHHAIAA